jgi:hypothetical protein
MEGENIMTGSNKESWPWIDQFMKGASVRSNDSINDTIKVKDVLKFIKNMPDSDRAIFKNDLLKIDFKYDNTLRFLRNFAKKHNIIKG